MGAGYAPAMHHGVWELVFLMVILKIPILYLCGVIYYAIKAQPKPGEGAGVTARIGPETDQGSGRPLRPRRFVPRPHGGPTRTYPRLPRTAHVRAQGERR
jgi:hypothetical protein